MCCVQLGCVGTITLPQSWISSAHSQMKLLLIILLYGKSWLVLEVFRSGSSLEPLVYEKAPSALNLHVAAKNLASIRNKLGIVNIILRSLYKCSSLVCVLHNLMKWQL